MLVTWIRNFLRSAEYGVRLGLGSVKRLGRLLIFGFELLILSRLFERHRRPATIVTEALLKTKSISVHPPELAVSRAGQPDKTWSHGFTSIYASLFLNLKNPDSFSAMRHAQPAPPFRGVYLWDSAYIAQVWKWWDADVARDILDAVVHLRDGDRLQHFASEFSRSRLTQPPLLAWSLDRLGQHVPLSVYRAWLAAAYEPLRAYHIWLYAKRRLPNGLFAWAHPYESGVENTPRFSSRDERKLDDTHHLGAPDFCSYVALQCEALAAMARALDKGDHARGYEQQAQVLKDAVNATLWDDEHGLYFDRDVHSGRFVRSRTIASLLPLWAGIPDRKRAQRLLNHILDPATFNTLIPLPSVALDDPDFERDMWRGPVWINTAYSVIEGLRRYGFHDAASDLAYRLCDGVYHTFARTGHFYEFYDPTDLGIDHLHRKRGNRWKRMSLGGKPVPDFVGWTGLVNTLVVDALFGAQATAGSLSIQPRFPAVAEGFEGSLTLPSFRLKIDLTVLKAGAVEGEIAGPALHQTFRAAFGELIPCGHASPSLVHLEPA
jgi:hypothetical protein